MALVQYLYRGLFPSRCVVCGLRGAALCSAHAVFTPAPVREAAPPLAGLVAPVAYSGAAVPLLEAYKYTGDRSLAVVLAAEILPKFPPEWTPETTLLVPIPLHWTRQFWRGFNQSALLSRALAEATGIPQCALLRRRRRTQQQARLGKAAREQNLTGAFVVRKCACSLPRSTRIVLVDDVYTTGATMRSAAGALHAAGYSDVFACTFAVAV